MLYPLSYAGWCGKSVLRDQVDDLFDDQSLGEQVVEGIHGLLLHRRQYVGVEVQGHGDVAVAEQLADDLWMDTLTEQEGGAGVAQLVELDGRYACRVCCVVGRPDRRETPVMRRRRSSPPVVFNRSAFSGFRFPPEVIILAVRWYLRFGLSFRDLEELLAERGIEVDHVTLYRWVQRFTPMLVDAARPCRHAVGSRWFVDETYVKVSGVWRYVYRAVDEEGQVIDVYVSPKRDLAAARQFFKRAIAAHGRPDEVVTDLAQALETGDRGAPSGSVPQHQAVRQQPRGV